MQFTIKKKFVQFIAMLILIVTLFSCSSIKTYEAGVLEIDNRFHDYGKVAIGDSSDFDFILTNKGKAGIYIIAVGLAQTGGSGNEPGSNALSFEDFSIKHVFDNSFNPPEEISLPLLKYFTLRSEESITVTVCFTPTTIYEVYACLEITHASLTENPAIVELIGNTGIQDIEVSPISYDFGQINVGETSSAQTFTIENMGSADLSISNVEFISGDISDFAIDDTQLINNLKPSESTTFDVTFTPTNNGNRSAVISITSNDPDENPFSFTIIGRGYMAGSDFNGDGYQDVIVGALRDDDGGINIGCAYIFFGSSNWDSSIDASNADVKLIGNLHGYFGWSAATAGDVNNDGYDDVIIGASGCVFIFFGNSNWNSIIDASNADVKLIGGNNIGVSVSSAGDVNNDDYDDVIVGQSYGYGGGGDSGLGYIFFGRANWNSSINASIADVKLIGEDTGDNFGWSVSSAGDINNDGYDDVIVGAYCDDDGGFASGCAFIFFGRANWNSIIDASIADIKLIGEDTNNHFGRSVSSAGDVNNDGYDDVIVGAPYGITAFIFFGSSNPSSSINASNADVSLFRTDGWLGISVSSAGDVNNDGFDDVIVGDNKASGSAGSEAGCAYIFFGSSNWNSSIDVSNADVKLIGEFHRDDLGSSVSSAGDVNNDGYDDVIIGAHYDDDSGINSGCAFVFFGSSNWHSSIDCYNADVILIGEDAGDEFGCSVSGGK
ncbi:MAG: choice-of-anchor D domain-containing protein [Planctomycetes bacterium]|nr:choice-of-anchor D domain-containing protein [Planctomycetota bacterium]